jgi:hypothetical protein
LYVWNSFLCERVANRLWSFLHQANARTHTLDVGELRY